MFFYRFCSFFIGFSRSLSLSPPFLSIPPRSFSVFPSPLPCAVLVCSLILSPVCSPHLPAFPSSASLTSPLYPPHLPAFLSSASLTSPLYPPHFPASPSPASRPPFPFSSRTFLFSHPLPLSSLPLFVRPFLHAPPPLVRLTERAFCATILSDKKTAPPKAPRDRYGRSATAPRNSQKRPKNRNGHSA